MKGLGSVGDMWHKEYFSMADQQYHDFMIKLLTMLEPRYEPVKTLLVNELDEFGEISFVSQGNIGIGYEINRVKKICFV